MHEFREHVDAPNNGHQCYGPSFQGLFTQAVDIVSQILSSGLDPGVAASNIDVKPPNAWDEVP